MIIMVTISNGKLTAKFNELGAELKSLTCGDTEYIWKGDEKIWASSCPVLFPICSGVIDNTYYIDGKEYNMTKHGFAKKSVFAVEDKKENEVTFLLTDSEETKKCYPYSFEFRIHYTLTDTKLEVEYNVKNTNDEEMFFSVGGHEGYACPEGIDKYDIVFDKTETLVNTVLTGPNTLGYEEFTVLENSNVFPLDYKYFAVDALVFQTLKSDSLVLKNRENGRAIKVEFKGFPYLLLWTKPDAPYICIEPWCGISDRDGCDQNFKTKQGIEHILPGETFVRVHTLEIL